jgi:apolipoprotein N-acyltransferase
MSLSSRLSRFLPQWQNALLAVLSAMLLILAFPDFELWFLAWFGLVPLLWAIDREKEHAGRGFVLGWIWGVVFFTGTCWWLTFAPITYAGFPWPLAYFLLLVVTSIVGIFPGIFGAIMAVLLKRFGNWAILAAPFVWVVAEFLRYWLTGNNWNAIGYSQAWNEKFLMYAPYGGIWLVSGVVCFLNLGYGVFLFFILRLYGRFFRGFFKNVAALKSGETPDLIDLGESPSPAVVKSFLVGWLTLQVIGLIYPLIFSQNRDATRANKSHAFIIAIQPNVPMSGLTYDKWQKLRTKHVQLAEAALANLPTDNQKTTTVIFPESPMNFLYDEDTEFQAFVSAFAAKNNVNVLFNSAEPDPANKKYFNSAVLVDTRGKEIAQYDKIFLVPFGESVPSPLQSIVPAFVGSFSYGNEYDLLPIGDAKAGVMICFESHFGQLSREYVRDGADVLIEMTNDGYLGPTPVLRQHLANAVFRAVETNRPLLRVTNVGISAYINERGEILDPTESYSEDTRVWSVAKSDGSQTFYVKYGDWFAWLCSAVTLGLLVFGLSYKRP